MAENFNINLDSAAQGANDVNNLGANIAKNAATTQEQQELVNQAVQRSKQAQIQTSEAQQEEQSGGFLSEKGQVPKTQAISELKIMLQKEGWEQADIDNAVQQAQDTWPDVVNAYDIRGFISALRQEKQTNPTHGTAFQATKADTGKKDENGDPLVPGQYYQADAEGNYTRTGEPAANVKAENGAGAADEKQWQKLLSQLESAIKSRFGVVGQLGTTIVRSLRAINTLHHGDLTKQDIDNVSTDIAAIYQGGVPSITQITENSYGTTLQNLAETLRHYTGVLGFMGNKQVMHDTVQKLTQVLNDMRNSAVAQMQEFVDMQYPGYKQLIDSNPERWDQMKQAVLNFITAGEVNPAGEVMPPTGAPPKAAVASPNPQGAQNDPLGIR